MKRNGIRLKSSGVGGLFLFLLIGFGALYWLFSGSESGLAEALPEDTTFLFQDTASGPVSQYILRTINKDAPGLKETGIATVSGKTVYAFRFAGKNREAFVKRFTVPGEPLERVKRPRGEQINPSFSSLYTLAKTNGWVLLSEDKQAIVDILSGQKSLSSADDYRAIRADLPTAPTQHMWLNTAQNDIWPDAIMPYKILLQTLKKVATNAGVSVKKRASGVLVNLKLDIENWAKKDLKKASVTPLSHLETLSQKTPAEALFALYGQNVFARYQHFLASLNAYDPTLGVLVSSSLNAWLESRLGNREIPEAMQGWLTGEYAFILDKNNTTEAVESGLLVVTETAIEPAQINAIAAEISQVSTPRIISKELPDGTVREEFVVENVPAYDENPVILPGGFYLAKNPEVAENALSIGVMSPNILVISSSETMLKSLIEMEPVDSLGRRQAVMDDLRKHFSASPGYAYLNLKNSHALWPYLIAAETENSPLAAVLKSLSERFRYGIFAQKEYRKSAFIDGILRYAD